MIKEKENVI